MVCGYAGQVSKALCCLAEDHPAAQQACTSAIQGVTAFLSHPDAAVKTQACQALACLTCDCPQNRTTAGQHGAVETLLQMLWTPCESLQQQQEVVQLLLALLVVALQVGRLCLFALSSSTCYCCSYAQGHSGPFDHMEKRQGFSELLRQTVAHCLHEHDISTLFCSPPWPVVRLSMVGIPGRQAHQCSYHQSRSLHLSAELSQGRCRQTFTSSFCC